MTMTRAEFDLGISISPTWQSDEDIDDLLGVGTLASSAGASTFLIGDKGDTTAVDRPNDVVLGWLLQGLADVERIGCLYLARKRPLASLLTSAGTLCGLIRHAVSTPVIGIMHGRGGRDPKIVVPTTDQAVSALRSSRIGEFELWLAAESGAALDRAGRRGDAWIANSYHDAAKLRSQIARVKSETNTPIRYTVRRDFVCDREARRAIDRRREILASGYRDGKFDGSSLIAGTADQCVEQMGEIASLGFDEVLVRPAVGGSEAIDQLGMLFDGWRSTLAPRTDSAEVL